MHPIVLFLSIFPILVLIVFGILVAFFHKNLYGPKDYDSTKEFQETYRNKNIPEAVSGFEIGASTSDIDKKPSPISIQKILDDIYRSELTFGYMIIHSTQILLERTTPKSGRYRIHVWIESIENRSLNGIDSVTYRLWDDFGESKYFTSTLSKSNFDLWINVYGEFPIAALILLKDGSKHTTLRYLDIPGRPTD